jgi:hypothetical protein
VAETLVKLAKALDRDAQLLLVFAGHITGARARQGDVPLAVEFRWRSIAE